MSYWDEVLAARDEDLVARCVACAASEGIEDPIWWVEKYKHTLVGQPGWGAAYAYALASEVEKPGRKNEVISDGMILAAVQSLK